MKKPDCTVAKAKALTMIEAAIETNHYGEDAVAFAKFVKRQVEACRKAITEERDAYSKGHQEFTERFLKDFPTLELDARFQPYQLLDLEAVLKSEYGIDLDLDEREYTVQEIIDAVYEEFE
jgi:hypothetical protein